MMRLALIAALCLALATPSRADLQTDADAVVAGIVVVGAALGVGITLLILHEKHKPGALTGCISSGAGGLTLTDDKDKRAYVLSGNPPGIMAGHRMTLEGKRHKNAFEAHSVTKDLGICQP
jgi:hypothetical protein